MKDIWHQSGLSDGGVDLNKWIRADIPIVFEASSVDPGDQKLVFEATVGDKHLGNIAIDDVTFTPGCKYENKFHFFSRNQSILNSGSLSLEQQLLCQHPPPQKLQLLHQLKPQRQQSKLQ